jgi:hypothetical protein
MTRKQALLAIGAWAACILGKWTYAKEENVPTFGVPEDFIVKIPPMETVTFELGDYKRLIVRFEKETVEYTTKELFEALKK